MAIKAQSFAQAQALGFDRQGKLALWQVLARAIQPGSRLSATRLAGSHAACDVLELAPFNEDQLYPNLAWLADNQARIEQELFQRLHPNGCPDLFLYDVTSSYLEGDHNALAAWGYNRDGKPGKKQIVIGLLCDGQGRALSIEVFVGNTGDPRTVGSQIAKVLQRFGGFVAFPRRAGDCAAKCNAPSPGCWPPPRGWCQRVPSGTPCS